MYLYIYIYIYIYMYIYVCIYIYIHSFVKKDSYTATDYGKIAPLVYADQLILFQNLPCLRRTLGISIHHFKISLMKIYKT